MRRESAVVARVDKRFLEPRDLHLRWSYARCRQARIDLRPRRRIRIEPLGCVLSALRTVYDCEFRVFARVGISARPKGPSPLLANSSVAFDIPIEIMTILPCAVSGLPDASSGCTWSAIA